MSSRVPDAVAAALAPFRGERVLVALSGGGDSVTLLHAVRRIAPSLGLSVGAAHLNHLLRGDESERDEAFVRDLCERWNVPLFVRRADAAAEAARLHRGVEETGRALRYAFFEEIAAGEGYDRILTAHTATDNLETVLLHLCRGTGTRGLCGIPPVSGRIVRPLLSCGREEIAAYLAAEGLPFVTDRTNADTRYNRNRLRAEAVPAMEALSPRLAEAITRMTESVRADEAYLSSLADALPDDTAVLAAAPAPLRRRALLKRAEAAGADPGAVHIEALERLLTAGGSLSLPGGVTATCSQGRLCFYTDRTEEAETAVFPDIPFSFGGQRWCLRRVTGEECEIIVKKQQKGFQNAVDCDRIAGSLTVRPRRSADRLHPAARGVGKEVRRLLSEARIPVGERGRVPLLCDEEGILLVAGICCDRRAATSTETRAVLLLENLAKES